MSPLPELFSHFNLHHCPPPPTISQPFSYTKSCIRRSHFHRRSCTIVSKHYFSSGRIVCGRLVAIGKHDPVMRHMASTNKPTRMGFSAKDRCQPFSPVSSMSPRALEQKWRFGIKSFSKGSRSIIIYFLGSVLFLSLARSHVFLMYSVLPHYV
jgi:hypothetical protein